MNRAVFLDRDGVVVGAEVVDGVPRPLAEPAVLSGVSESCEQLRQAGFLLVLVTNQPDISRGRTTRAAVDSVNERLQAELMLDLVQVCPHDDADHCACRKPAPGMLVEAAKALDIHLPTSFMVGDRWRDVEAGTRAGAHTVFIDHHYPERAPTAPDFIAASLCDAVPHILQRSSQELHHESH